MDTDNRVRQGDRGGLEGVKGGKRRRYIIFSIKFKIKKNMAKPHSQTKMWSPYIFCYSVSARSSMRLSNRFLICGLTSKPSRFSCSHLPNPGASYPLTFHPTSQQRWVGGESKRQTFGLHGNFSGKGHE